MLNLRMTARISRSPAHQKRGRPALYLNGSGTLYALTLDGVGSIERLLIAPDGRTIALDGRATDGSSIAAVASLTR